MNDTGSVKYIQSSLLPRTMTEVIGIESINKLKTNQCRTHQSLNHLLATLFVEQPWQQRKKNKKKQL